MISAHYKEIAQKSLLLKPLSDQLVDALIKEASIENYTRNETIFSHGDECHAIHIVLDGWIKLYRITKSGNETVVSIFTRGQSFGEALALQNVVYPVSAEAVTNCTLMHVPSKAIINLIKREPEVALSFLSSTFSHLHSLVSQLEQLKAQTGTQRVANFLLTLCDQKCGKCVVEMPYDKTLIAGRLGLKPESLSRAFARLRPMHIKIEKNFAHIQNVETLRNYVEAQI